MVDAPDPVVCYEEGRERIIEAFEPLGEGYQEGDESGGSAAECHGVMVTGMDSFWRRRETVPRLSRN